MKRGLRLFFVLIIGIFFINFVSSADCSITVKLINQDPYPAIPGESVKVVFQVTGISNPDCGEISLRLNDKYPFTLEGGQNAEYSFRSGIYSQNYKQFYLAPFNLRVDENALDGNQTIEFTYSFLSNGIPTIFNENFNISVEDVTADFEVHISDYSFITNKLTFDLLNIGKNDIEAVAVDLVDQEGVQAIGSKRYIIGDMDSNQDDLASFNAKLDGKKDILIRISYSDSAGNRRYEDKTVTFDPRPFEIAEEDENNGLSASNAFIIGFIIPIVVWICVWYYKRRKNKNKFVHKHH